MATSSFYLKVISANRVFFAGKCRSLIVPEFDGQKEILAHHEDMVIAIDEGQMKFQPEGSDEWIHAVVGMGFVEIVNNRVTLLVETAEKPEEIDVRRAEEAKQRLNFTDHISMQLRSNVLIVEKRCTVYLRYSTAGSTVDLCHLHSITIHSRTKKSSRNSSRHSLFPRL